MDQAAIFSEAIRQGSSSSKEKIKENLSFLLAVLRSKSTADSSTLFDGIKILLAGDDPSLDLLNEINTLSQIPPQEFGSVLATEVAAAERLALLASIHETLLQPKVKEFVEQSNSDLLTIFNIAKKTQDYLDETTIKGLRWTREFVPVFLQKILENPSILLDFTIAATGGNFPTGWENVESFISRWVDFRDKSPEHNLPDGFFEAQYPGYQPAAIHPQVIRILRQSFLKQLIQGNAQEEIKAFCKWLVDCVFDGKLLEDIKLESLFASGSLILALAQQQGVSILEDGQLSVPTTAVFWGELSERVLKTIVQNSQQIETVPPFWQNKQAKIRQLIYTCPEWYSAPLVVNLRSRAAKLLGEELEAFKTAILQEDLKLTEDKFKPEIELSPQSALPELRPAKPFDADLPEREDYFKKLDSLNSQIINISSFDSVVQEIATNTLQRRTAFKQRLMSPLAEPALPALCAFSFEQPDRLNLALATYLRQQVSQFSIDSKLVRAGNLIQETLANQAVWVDVINQTVTTDGQALSSWSKLEIWDGLRARLARSSDNQGDRNVAQYLSQQLPDWLQNEAIDPPTGLDLNAIRPILAELAHLGVSIQLGTYQTLTNRLENLITRDALDDALKTSLAAVRLELGLTALVIGGAPSQTFKQFESPSKALFEQFAGWIKRSIESSNVWESRAGMNALILLARMVEGTGDLLINSAIKTAMPSGSRASRLISQSVNQLFSAGSKGAGLPLAFAAFDLARYAREATLSIAPQVTDSFAPVWAAEPIPSFINRLTDQLGTATRTTLQKMVAEGGIGIKVLLLSLLQIKLDELDLERQLIVQPLRRNTSPQEAKLRHNVILRQIDDLHKAVRFVFCREQLLLNEFPEGSGEIKPWWQTSYWLASSSNVPETGQLSLIGSVSPTLVATLEEGRISSEIQTLLGGTSGQAMVSPVLKGQRWLIDDPQPDRSNKTYQIEQDSKAINLNVYRVEAPFLLINWVGSYPNNVDVNLLSLAASLSATVPVVSEDNPKDIDGRYEEEFPDLSWKDTTDKLQKAIKDLKEVEGQYENALREQIDGSRADEIINLLKQPLLLNTADYREQMVAAIAEVREAEADLEVAEFESLATQFEVLANQMLYEAAEVEVQRQSVLEEVSKFDEQIAQLERDAEEIRKRQVLTSKDIAKRDIDIAKNTREKAIKESKKVEIARKAILREIELLKKLLETPTPVEINGTQVTAKGQVGAMAYKVEATLMKQLNENLETAKVELKKAKDAEAERKKKEKRRKLIGGICRFVGAVIGTIYGGPAGAALGAEIGGAIGELANGVIENKAPEEILVGLIDNGFAIASAAGVDLEKELNTLGAKGAAQLDQFFDQLDSSLGPMLDSLPKILDEQMLKDAIVVLDLPEVPILTNLLEKSYEDLRKDIPNLGQLGTALKVIQYDSPRQFLDRLSDNLFKNTRNNAEGIKALSQAIGKKIDDLQTEEGLREAAKRFAKLVVTRVGKEAPNFRQDAIATWIRNKRNNKQWWNDVVQKEAKNLVKELFPDSQRGAEVLANLESSLINPEIIRGELQRYLDPWQIELDRRISEITAVDKNEPQPASAVAAAEQSIKYLETRIQMFNTSLLPWLKGDGNAQSNKLLLDLNKLQTEKLPTSDIDLNIAELDEASAQLSEANAKAALENMERELERVGKLYQVADLKVSKATLLNKVSNLAKLRAGDLERAQKNSLKASEKRQQAAQAKVKSAQFNLEAKKALSQAAMQRGAESSRIRGSLSQPALQLPNLAVNSTNRMRIRYVRSLENATDSYRELLRFYKSAGAIDIPVLDRNSKWSEALKDWAEEAQTKFNTSVDQNDPQTVEWDLTPEQIAALLSPDGFRVFLASEITEALPLFTVSRDLENYLREGELQNSPWKRVFAQVGINLSSEVSAELDGGGNWKIIDKQIVPIRVTSYSYTRKGEPVHSWNLQSEAITYTVISQENTLTVTRRQEPPAAGRSPLPNQYWEQIAPEAASTGRVIGVFLDATIEGTEQKLSEGDYAIEVRHLGDFWTNRKQVKLLRTTKPLRRSRTVFLQKDIFPANALENINMLSKSEGDPHPYAVQGTPLSGTTLIRLLALGPRQFSKMKVRLLYKFSAPTG